MNVLDEIDLEAGAFYMMDRGYVDFRRLYRFTLKDRRFSLCAGRHRAQTAENRGQPLPTSTGFQCYPFRENSHFTGTSVR
jgi:hypothetical protein